MSPLIDDAKEGYVPDRKKEILHMKGEEVVESDEEELNEVKALPVPKKHKVEQAKGKGDADSSSDEENADPE